LPPARKVSLSSDSTNQPVRKSSGTPETSHQSTPKVTKSKKVLIRPNCTMQRRTATMLQ
jgi:hypothetical protein